MVPVKGITGLIDFTGRTVLNSLVEREVKAPASKVGHGGEIWLK